MPPGGATAVFLEGDNINRLALDHLVEGVAVVAARRGVLAGIVARRFELQLRGAAFGIFRLVHRAPDGFAGGPLDLAAQRQFFRPEIAGNNRARGQIADGGGNYLAGRHGTTPFMSQDISTGLATYQLR